MSPGELVDPHDKDYYHPDWAHYKVEQHAEHFAHLVGDMIREYHNSSNRVGLISAHFDARLFGHWWFEGSQWLGIVLRHLADTPSIELTTPLGFITAHSPQDSIDVVEGSWGNGGGHFIWDNPSTHWILPLIHQAEARMEVLAKKFKKPGDDERVVLNQAARELMLLQSADWPLIITTQQDHAYAPQRVKHHLERFETLANSLEVWSGRSSQR